MIRILGPRDRRDPQAVNTTSHSASDWSRGLSPFVLGPVALYGGHTARLFENAWQYSKLYPEHADREGLPTAGYWAWARQGWASRTPRRYPMGKDPSTNRGRKPLCSVWRGERLGYVDARKAIYVPLYRDAVKGTEAFRRLRETYERDGRITLFDFDGYDYLEAGTTLAKALLDPRRIFGHSFVLALMLTHGPDFTVDQVLAEAS